MSKNLIEIKKLKKEFKNNNSVVKVLNNVNINIESGKLVALVGPSGSGKSTFLHLLALLDEPTQGKIFLFGNSITNISEDKKNKIIKDYISIIFQNNNLLSDFTALENVAIPLIIRNQNYKNSIEKAKKVLAKVNLSHRLNYFPSDLSGGEQQRVAIARSLAADTKIILADEPTGNLDYKTSNEVFSYFLKLKEKNKTILIATHNRELAKKADYTLSLVNGNIKRKSK
ncbi:MAG: ABC transporter ATP-binding protein [Pelagibacteraceae bacterium]|jgi:ABC-type lipoprotein export system ATPase subunit|nr:ABC transporter ATP-binding protein [Pelagibacteraceae bacterium]MBO6481126.1 ABC transporter ATP-binding protein [Pelagibacteraceae bacterium]MBO6484250.1 ABC transporter ATP-binding protein [Pelagibacteraceae bacterium]MBO6485219.1 ABC transporter ATP-binding protein [Pelagibacteraceae bacterium]MBO6488027.1 ABC transporter ATP-binding protein [Pelagibacteraceae bacterium]